MKKIILLILLILAGCSSFKDYYHRICTYRQILKIENQEIIIGIDRPERVQIGQIFNICKSIPELASSEHHYKTIVVGIAQIIKFENDETARAKILYGSADDECWANIP